MCLLTQINTPFIAEEDMTVYKILETYSSGNLCSLYYDFYWKIGVTYTQKIIARRFTGSNPCAFTHDTLADTGIKGVPPDKLLCITEGFHSYATLQRAKHIYRKHETLVECTIPKGATYYKDMSDLLVSNQLRVDKIIDPCA